MASRSNDPAVDVRSVFEQTLRDHALVCPGETILLAVSGGADSTALARLFASIAPEWKLALHVLHVNHGLRGRESDEDEAFVRRLASELFLPFETRRAEHSLARKGESLQMAARRVRYEALEEAAKRLGAHAIATGHTRDDRVETLLYNLLRGAGPRGLGAIPYRRGAVIRPLLDLGRPEIESYLKDLGATFRIDRSNLGTGYDRNRIRLEVLPLVESLLGRRVDRPLARAAEILAETDAYLAGEAAAWLAGRETEVGGAIVVSASSLTSLPRALARQVVRSLAARVSASSYEPSHERVESVLRLASKGGAGIALLAGGCEVRREADRLTFSRRGAPAPPFRVPLPVPGEALLPDGGRIVCRLVAEDERARAMPRGNDRVWLDRDRLRPPLVVRSRAEGDRFRPLGASGERKLQDLLVDRKVPRSERSRLPIVADEDGIVWVAGVEIADRARISSGAPSILEVAFCRPGNDT
jgi:tRNA(Ile)-lysidine synthase